MLRAFSFQTPGAGTASSCCCSVLRLDENYMLDCWDNTLALPPQTGMSLLKVVSWDGGCPQKEPVPSWETAQTSALCNRSGSLQCTARAMLSTTCSTSSPRAGHGTKMCWHKITAGRSQQSPVRMWPWATPELEQIHSIYQGPTALQGPGVKERLAQVWLRSLLGK